MIERYLAVPALALMVFAAVAIGGWTMLEPGRRAHRLDGRGAALLVVVRRGLHGTHLNLSRFDNELRFRGQAHHASRRCSTIRGCRPGCAAGP